MQDKQNKHGIIWFRNNLRAMDNTALEKAIADCGQVTGIYFFDPREYSPTPWGFPKMGGHRLGFLLQSLQDLQRELHALHIPLHIQAGRPEDHFPELITSWKIAAIYTQKEWTTEEVLVTHAIKKNTHIPLLEFYDQFLIHPEDLPFHTEDIPEVFTRFRKVAEANMKVRSTAHCPVTLKPGKPLPGLNEVLPTHRDLNIPEAGDDSRSAFPFAGGTTEALKRMDYYFWKTKKLQYYKRTRNGLIGVDYSSKLSPWLANGSISARMIYREVIKFEEQVVRNEDTYWLLFELLWRDYFKYISMKHGNRLFLAGGIKQQVRNLLYNPSVFQRWVAGKTGDTFVDANMTELAKTGWMSNRGRQNVASFLVNELQQDWRAGAAWFENKLLDYDVHSNWGNWNYVSGVGNDPRDRKFNTRTQAERYDPSGTYQKRWLQNTLF